MLKENNVKKQSSDQILTGKARLYQLHDTISHYRYNLHYSFILFCCSRRRLCDSRVKPQTYTRLARNVIPSRQLRGVANLSSRFSSIESLFRRRLIDDIRFYYHYSTGKRVKRGRFASTITNGWVMNALRKSQGNELLIAIDSIFTRRCFSHRVTKELCSRLTHGESVIDLHLFVCLPQTIVPRRTGPGV